MSKHPIAWHKECLNNAKRHLATEFEAHERKRIELLEKIETVQFRAQQIIEAESRGLTEFDQEKFLVKKKTKKD